HPAQGVATSSGGRLDECRGPLRGCELDRTVGHHLQPFVELFGGNSDAPTFTYVHRGDATYRKVEIGRCNAELVRSTHRDEHVRQRRHGALLVSDSLTSPHQSQELLFGNGYVHGPLCTLLARPVNRQTIDRGFSFS